MSAAVETNEVYDDVEQQKMDMHGSSGRSTRMLVAIGVFVLYSYLVMNEGAVRVSFVAKPPLSSEGIPTIVQLISAVGEALFGLVGLMVGGSLLLYNGGSKMITTLWMGMAFVLGWFVFIVWVLALPIYGLINEREVPPDGPFSVFSLSQWDLLRCMSLLAGAVWCFALQGGQFMVANVIRGFQANGESKGAGYAKARMIMWSVNIFLSAIFFIIAGALARSVYPGGELPGPVPAPPIFILFSELTIIAGVVQLIFACFSLLVAFTGSMFGLHPYVTGACWLINLICAVWGQVWRAGLTAPTTLVAGLSVFLFYNVSYSAVEYQKELEESQ